ncbi:MAG: tetratricopeptide repeat protein [Anaerolineae bacterium]
MNATLSLSLLGPPQIQLDDKPVSGLSPRKVKALLIYLDYTAQPQPRIHLSNLFFDDRPPEQAAANLRAMISRLRRKLKPFIVTDKESVAFDTRADFWLDTAVLNQTIITTRQQIKQDSFLTPETAVQLTDALTLYRGEFLAGFHIREARNFEEWVLLERERWHHQIGEALQTLVTFHLHRREYAAGIAQVRRLIRLDNLQESAHRRLMLLLARSGDRAAALAQYETCRQILAQELGVAPMAETTALYKRIRDAETAVPHHFPPQFTPFIGRTSELAQISQRLDDPDCRLLTLLGPGGIGKTRLALQTAESQTDAFLNGVYFVPLTPVSAPETLVAAIADALHFAFYSKESPQNQLLNYLREKELLLVLDNFEHLLAGARLVSDILQHAPQVKILATSRQRLHLRWEWIFDVRGLPYPQTETDEQVEHYSAIQLFAQCAARVQPDFSLDAEKSNVVHICRLTEGMPLAIELAAAQIRVRTGREIAAAIERSLDLLATSLQDVPKRHRSVRATFDGSWQGLTEAEQTTFRKLSVFSGGFHHEAAWQTTGASRATLDALAAKSLLRITASGRFEMHELLRQYAAEMLNAFPQSQKEVEAQHTVYYAAYLHQRENALRGQKQKETLAEINKEIENARAAWQRALKDHRAEAIARSLEGLFRFYDIRSWLQEGRELFAHAAAEIQKNVKPECPEQERLLLGKLLARQSWFCFRLGLYESAQTLAQESIVCLSNTSAPCEEAFARLVLGAVADEQGDYEQAQMLFQKSRMLYQAAGDQWGLAAAFEHLGDVARMVGDYEQARQHYQQSQSLFQEIGDRDRIAGAFNSLGGIAGATGAYDQAKIYFEKSLAICREVDDRFGIVSASHNLSNVAYLQGDYAAAKQLRQETLSICREIGFRWGVASSLRHLGDVSRHLGALDAAQNLYQESLIIQREMGHQRDVALTLNSLGGLAQAAGVYEKAEEHYRQALQVAMEIQSAPVALAILGGWGELLAQEGKQEQSLTLLTYVLHHPAAEKQTQDRIADFWGEFFSQHDLPVAGPAEKGELPALELVTQTLLA